MSEYKFRTATVRLSAGVITATFPDGYVNEMNTHWLNTPEYRDIARWAGYGDQWRLYALEHELTHHWLADRMGWNYSYSLRENPPTPWPQHVAWEEHLVNALQRLAVTGEQDPYRVPNLIWGDHLERVVEEWRTVVRGISRNHPEFCR